MSEKAETFSDTNANTLASRATAAPRPCAKLLALEERGLLHASSNLKEVAARYAISLTDQVHATINHANDAVAKQYVPSEDELTILPQEDRDPIGDQAFAPVKGIVHRYPDRVLFKVTAICAVYCRYCFRREMVGQGDKPLDAAEIEAALQYIRANRDIYEVILTGGDPMVLSPRQLGHIVENLNAIDHVKVIRIHTRIPIVQPKRITGTLCTLFTQSPKAIYIALHINHTQELNASVRSAVERLHNAGCTLLSQSVLLKGINDDTDILEELMRAIVAMNVKPYYLHHPDLARGTSHFRLSLEEGFAIYRSLRGRISGLCQPEYILDIPGGAGKIPVNASYIDALGAGRYHVQDYQGHTHLYEDKL